MRKLSILCFISLLNISTLSVVDARKLRGGDSLKLSDIAVNEIQEKESQKRKVSMEFVAMLHDA